MMTALCKEPEGDRYRSVYPLVRTAENIEQLKQKISEVMSLIGEEETLGSVKRSSFYLVDDVGVVAIVDDVLGFSHAHITFWDRRLRGREELCKALGQMHMEATGLQELLTAIPLSARTVLAFAKRIGFELLEEIDGVAILTLRRN